MAFMELVKFPARSAFPATGDNNRLYVDLHSKRIYYWERGAYQIASPDIVEQGSNPISEAFSYAGIVATVEELPTEGNRIGDVYIVEQDEGHEQNSSYVWSGTEWIEIGGDMEHLVAISWSALKDLRDAGELVPGAHYRITDYVTTTVQENTQSAGHTFDLIVTADDVDKLNEDARACLHAEDVYFADSKLEAWKLKYCLDNDATRFAWADEENGKGVIYRMIDEFNNDIPYDFKNILFVKNGIEVFTFGTVPGVNYNQWGGNYNVTRNDAIDVIVSEVQYYGYTCSSTPISWSTPNFWVTDDLILTTSTLYSISGETVTEMNMGGTLSLAVLSDISLTYNARGNVMKPAFAEYSYRAYTLNFNTFGNYCRYNTFGADCISNTFGSGCHSNTFGNSCQSNTFGSGCHSNTFSNNCGTNTFGSGCYFNAFSNNCGTNTFGNDCKYNTFGNDCHSNTFGNSCNSNAFGNYCTFNTFGNGCYYNTFGKRCSYLKISENTGEKKYLDIDNGLSGVSSANQLELYDPTIANKTYRISFKKDINGKILMTWQDDKLIEGGKYKNNNTDGTWKDIEGTIQSITWSALKTLRDNSELFAGQQYRITDYVTTTAQSNTQSAGHQFDIIVTADSVNKLNEQARAIQHDGDTYFANSKLEAWQVWYSLDNDTNRFAWADIVNGKGVIYRMIDEWNNDCPYDFKNIKFLRTDGSPAYITTTGYYYTFGKYDLGDTSVLNTNTKLLVFNNKIALNIKAVYKGWGYVLTKQELNNIVFITIGSSDNASATFDNIISEGCYNLTFNRSCYYNTFGNGCHSNTFGDSCNSNTFGDSCNSNTFGNSCHSNTFGNSCHSNTFGDNCYRNTFGDACYYLKISENAGIKRSLNIDNELYGFSSANQLDLYDIAIVNNSYTITFKRSYQAGYLMLWATNTGTMTGKYKALNTDLTWTDL